MNLIIFIIIKIILLLVYKLAIPSTKPYPHLKHLLAQSHCLMFISQRSEELNELIKHLKEQQVQLFS